MALDDEGGGLREPLVRSGEDDCGGDVEGGVEQTPHPADSADADGEGKPRAGRLLGLALEHWRWLLLGCLALTVRLPFSIVQPHLVSVGVIGSLLQRDASGLQRSLVLFVAAGTVDAILDFFCVFLFSHCKNRIIRSLRNRLFGNILRQEAGFFDKSRTGDILSRLTSDTVEMANDLTWVFRFSIEAVVRIAGVAGYMFYISPRLAAVSCAAIPLVALGNKYYGRWLHNNSKKVQAALAAANARAQESISAVRTVFSFAAEQMEGRAYASCVQEHYRLSNWQAVADGIYYMLFSTFLMQVAVQAMILAYGSRLYWTGELRLEELVAFLMYRDQLQNWTGMLLNSFSSLIKSSGAAHQVFMMLERVPQLRPSSGVVPEAPEGCVRFEGVHFAYPTRPAARVLRGLTLEVQPGQLVALTGPSGAGKSTCFHLLEHFYEPLQGRVLLDGVNVHQLDHEWLHAHVGLVGQDPVLFSGTILDNIMYSLLSQGREQGFETANGLEGADGVPAAVVEAARVANAHDFIMGLPDGYRTEIGERGVQMSGGQKQRVAIARAVLQDPKVLLLDEATSSLDAESEALVQAALEHATRGRTTLVIAHRLSTVRNADKILVLAGGQVVEEGTHTDLMARPLVDGRVTYRALVQRQHAFLDG